MHTPTPAAAPPAMRLLLTEAEAAATIGFTRRFLENRRLRGNGPPYVVVGRNVRYRYEDLLAWVEAQPRRKHTSDSGEAA